MTLKADGFDLSYTKTVKRVLTLYRIVQDNPGLAFDDIVYEYMNQVEGHGSASTIDRYLRAMMRLEFVERAKMDGIYRYFPTDRIRKQRKKKDAK